jgi:hypothetical protein
MASKNIKAASKATKAVKVTKKMAVSVLASEVAKGLPACSFPTRKSVVRAAAVSASWQDPKTREARSKRDAVYVSINGAEPMLHASTRKAFTAYLLPDSKHQEFRAALKKEGSKVFELMGVKYAFTVYSVYHSAEAAKTAASNRLRIGADWEYTFKVGSSVVLKSNPTVLLGEVNVINYCGDDAYDEVIVARDDNGDLEAFEAWELAEFVKPEQAKDDHPASVAGHAKWVEAQRSVTVKFETLPLLAQFETRATRDTYLKVGNSTAIHLQVPEKADHGVWELKAGKQGKQRFKKNEQVISLTK